MLAVIDSNAAPPSRLRIMHFYLTSVRSPPTREEAFHFRSHVATHTHGGDLLPPHEAGLLERWKSGTESLALLVDSLLFDLDEEVPLASRLRSAVLASPHLGALHPLPRGSGWRRLLHDPGGSSPGNRTNMECALRSLCRDVDRGGIGEAGDAKREVFRHLRMRWGEEEEREEEREAGSGSVAAAAAREEGADLLLALASSSSPPASVQTDSRRFVAMLDACLLGMRRSEERALREEEEEAGREASSPLAQQVRARQRADSEMTTSLLALRCGSRDDLPVDERGVVSAGHFLGVPRASLPADPRDLIEWEGLPVLSGTLLGPSSSASTAVTAKRRRENEERVSRLALEGTRRCLAMRARVDAMRWPEGEGEEEEEDEEEDGEEEEDNTGESEDLPSSETESWIDEDDGADMAGWIVVGRGCGEERRDQWEREVGVGCLASESDDESESEGHSGDEGDVPHDSVVALESA